VRVKKKKARRRAPLHSNARGKNHRQGHTKQAEQTPRQPKTPPPSTDANIHITTPIPRSKTQLITRGSKKEGVNKHNRRRYKCHLQHHGRGATQSDTKAMLDLGDWEQQGGVFWWSGCPYPQNPISELTRVPVNYPPRLGVSKFCVVVFVDGGDGGLDILCGVCHPAWA